MENSVSNGITGVTNLAFEEREHDRRFPSAATTEDEQLEGVVERFNTIVSKQKRGNCSKSLNAEQ